MEYVEITVDLDFDVSYLLLKNCYNGSILSGFPCGRHNCYIILLLRMNIFVLHYLWNVSLGCYRLNVTPDFVRVVLRL